MKGDGEIADVQTANYVERENSRAAHPEPLSWLQSDSSEQSSLTFLNPMVCNMNHLMLNRLQVKLSGRLLCKRTAHNVL